MLISWLAKWGYIIHKISKLIFNRIFTKENKIFIQIIWSTVIALHVYLKIISNNRFQTDRTRLVQFQRWANLDYNSKLEPWQKKKDYKKQRTCPRWTTFRQKISLLPLQFSSWRFLVLYAIWLYAWRVKNTFPWLWSFTKVSSKVINTFFV